MLTLLSRSRPTGPKGTIEEEEGWQDSRSVYISSVLYAQCETVCVCVCVCRGMKQQWRHSRERWI